MRQPPEKLDTGASSSATLKPRPSSIACARGRASKPPASWIASCASRHRMAVVAGLGARQLGLRLGQGGVAGEDEVGRALVGLRHLLRHLADAPARRHGDVAGVGVQPVGEQREQRRLAGAVAADQADLLARLDGEAGAIENELDAATQRDLGENEHG